MAKLIQVRHSLLKGASKYSRGSLLAMHINENSSVVLCMLEVASYLLQEYLSANYRYKINVME